jgi:parvulin-like peptidyl-prolyl isomerase
MMHSHTFSRVFLYLVITTGLWLSYSISGSAFSILEMLGIGTDETEEAKKPDNGQKQVKPSTQKSNTDKKSTKLSKQNQEGSADKLKPELDLSDLQKTLSVLDESQRKKVLADEEVFKNFVKQEANNESVLIAARVNKIESNEKTIVLAQRSVDNIVRELYLNQLLASKIPADFPRDEQVQEYYDKNRDKFVIEERVHAWQIFLPVSGDMSKKDIELLKKKAETITVNLKKKKTDFASAANKYSKHEASRLSGGYMGLIKISDMKPEIKTAIKNLKQGDISKPVKTDDGIHILKRGAIVPRQDVTLEQVRPKITELMIKQLRIQLRQAVFKQASVTYPIDIQDKKIEEWRLKLRTN